MELNDLKPLENYCKRKEVPYIGKIKGQLLLDTVKKLKPKRVLELGCAVGYSGVILSSEGAKLISIDYDHKAINKAKKTFIKYNVDYLIIYDDCTRAINKFEFSDKFDMIFFDFEKRHYIDILDKAISLLNKGGILFADNVSNKKCKEFIDALKKNKKLKTEFLDDVTISSKK